MNSTKKLGVTTFATLALVALSAGRVRARDANQIEIVTGFGAKEACSCVFVVEQTDAYCTAFAQTGVAVAEITIDRKAQTVEASLAGNKRIARFTPGEGCQTEALP